MTTSRQAPGGHHTARLPAAALASLLLALSAAGCAPITRDQESSGSPSAQGTQTSAGVLPGTPASPISPPGQGTAPDWVSVAAFAGPSTVSIQVIGANSVSAGSGIIWDAEGRILTNHHVVAGSGLRILVTVSSSLSYEASVVGTDPLTDIAVLALRNPPQGLTPATWGDSAAVRVGDPVMAIGDPLGLQNTVTTGIISALNRPVATQQTDSTEPDNPFDPRLDPSPSTVTSYTSALQTDAAVNPGNSGGALVDAQGRVIGVNSAIASNSGADTAGSIGLGFAIPIGTARLIAEQLIATGRAQHPALGVTVSTGTAELNGAIAAGARVVGVVPDGSGDRAGVTTGDLITAVDGVVTPTPTALTAYIRSLRIGDGHQVSLVRQGALTTVDVTLQAGD